MDDNLLLWRIERFGISVSNEKFTHSVFHKKTDSNAELTIDLAGQPGAVVSSIRGFSLANLKTDELGYSFGWTFEPTEKFSSNFEVKISSLNSEYTLQNHYQAGLINSLRQVAEKTKISTSAICSLLNGKRKLGLTFLEILKGPCPRKVTIGARRIFLYLPDYGLTFSLL